jgi:hypothetical protein
MSGFRSIEQLDRNDGKEGGILLEGCEMSKRVHGIINGPEGD